ncbi:MAG: hypothetical protein PF517_06915 [Salinivirgaceae bacterium]|jgi:hypothetical protein|nr:hypothetical protein [Salinivirgaceae bacterium]
MKHVINLLFIFCLSIVLQSAAFGQCKTFTKKECKPKLSPYIYNGQLNSAVLNEGDVAELMLTFYSNQDYRVLVCGAEELGPIEFKLKDAGGQELFTNADHNMIDTWDFHTKSTQQLMIEVSVPLSSTDELYKNGCVSILVGFKDKE